MRLRLPGLANFAYHHMDLQLDFAKQAWSDEAGLEVAAIVQRCEMAQFHAANSLSQNSFSIFILADRFN